MSDGVSFLGNKWLSDVNLHKDKDIQRILDLIEAWANAKICSPGNDVSLVAWLAKQVLLVSIAIIAVYCLRLTMLM